MYTYLKYTRCLNKNVTNICRIHKTAIEHS